MDGLFVSGEFFHELNTELSGIETLANAFSGWAEGAGVSVDVAFATNVVLDELVTNVIIYGLGEGRPGTITVRAVATPDYLWVELRDSAPFFDPFQTPPPNLALDIDEREIGGLGVHFVRTLMDEWSYAREGMQNVVCMKKNLVRQA